MFAGIVAGTGRIVEVTSAPGAALRLGVDVSVLRRKLVLGASVSVSGVCLTVVRSTRARSTGVRSTPVRSTCGRAWFDVVGETIRRTTLGDLREGDVVNLEGALRLGDEVGGHLVEGHVDGVGEVTAVDVRADETWMTIRAPREVHGTLAEKGYVTVHGASLTVASLGKPRADGSGAFSVALIPTTLGLTTLGTAVVGTRLNLEGDPVGRHVRRWMAGAALVPQAGVAARRSRAARSGRVGRG
jgi:riboflavin synthase alpha subunit